MAYQTSATNGGSIADATDNWDLLQKLINFITGVSAGETGYTLPVAERWTVLKSDTTSVPGEWFVYLHGPGLSGSDDIYVNIRVYDVNGSNLHNWEILGATGFDSSRDIYNQPNGSTITSVFTMSNSDMPWWFVVSGRRIIAVAQTSGSVSFSCYLGWYLPYATPSEMPYPMFNGGSTCNTTYSYTDLSYKLGNFYDGPIQANTATSNAAGQLRHSDSTWLGVGNYVQTTASTRGAKPSSPGCWTSPFESGTTASYAYGIIENVDGSFAVQPIVIYSKENGGNIYGEIEGMYFSASGTVGKKFPDTITIASDTYLCLNNTYRTSEVTGALLLA